jgi:aminomethyltransferase
MEKKTPLYQTHVDAGGRMVEFGGYLMPVQYPTGVLAEHMAVRQRAGLFDVSHMAELTLEGPDALRNLQWLVTADLSKMTDGQVKYAMLCNDRGGIVDDLVVCRRAADRYLLVVNAGNHDKDAAWVSSHLAGDVRYADISESVAQLALQGPRSGEILQKLCDASDLPEKYYHFTEPVALRLPSRTISALVSQTGYTGEFGYELYCAAQDAAELWDALLAAGRDQGLIPCGLGARDTLRLEAGMPLYGHEMDEDVSPREAGLPCKLDGKDFLGRAAILARGEPTARRVGLKVTGRGIVREHCDLYGADGALVGHTTSGTFCPYLNLSAAMGYVALSAAEPGTALEADVRGRRIPMEVVPLPFYKIQR